MDAALEVAITREHRRRVEIAGDDLGIDRRFQRTTHAVTRGAGEGDDVEAEGLQVGQETGVL